MLIKNYIGGDRRLVNGSRGVVVRFEQGGGGGGAPEALPVVFFRATKSEVLVKRELFTYDRDGETIASRFQIPLLLGWVSVSSFCCVRTRFRTHSADCIVRPLLCVRCLLLYWLGHYDPQNSGHDLGRGRRRFRRSPGLVCARAVLRRCITGPLYRLSADHRLQCEIKRR